MQWSQLGERFTFDPFLVPHLGVHVAYQTRPETVGLMLLSIGYA